MQAEIAFDDPILIFGGPYSNLQASEAMLTEAERLQIPRGRVICTGDLAAYCGSPAETVELIRRSGIHVVLGNCDEQLARYGDDCGCGFAEGTACHRLSAAWFSFASGQISAGARAWLSTLPRRLEIVLAGRRFCVVHGGVDQINRFIFASTPVAEKRRELDLARCDGVIAGHCGLPFTESMDDRLWHNAGVIGMPANDATPRVWFSLLTPLAEGLLIEHRALTYDHEQAAAAMRRAGLSTEYREALSSGLWPNLDILPERERRSQGTPLSFSPIVWKQKAALASLIQ